MIEAPLTLAHDAPIAAPTLRAYLSDWAARDADRQPLAALIAGFAEASIPLANRLALGRLPGDPARVLGRNDSGDAQKALDLAAHDHLLKAFDGLEVARVLSEEAEEVITLDLQGRFDVAMDPVDGSGSIGIGAPLGAFFAVFPAGPSFLRSGREMIAAAYVSLGHSVDFGFSLGDGVVIATLDPTTGDFHVDTTGVTVPENTTTIAFNASNMRLWSAGLQRYADDLLHGADGPRGCDYNMRWLAAAVADLHRILRQGGVFLYPADNRPGYEDGVLRMAYEAFPIAFLVEQAGGTATDGRRDILDLVPGRSHDRVPLIFGSRAEVATLRTYLDASDR